MAPHDIDARLVRALLAQDLASFIIKTFATSTPAAPFYPTGTSR